MSVALDYPHIQKTGVQPAHLHSVPRIRVVQILLDYLRPRWLQGANGPRATWIANPPAT